MTEFERTPRSLFDIDAMQIISIAKTIKSDSPEVGTAIRRIAIKHPTLEAIMGENDDLYDDNLRHAIGQQSFFGSCTAYTVVEAISEQMGIPLPVDSGIPLRPEWMKDVISTMNDQDITENPYAAFVGISYAQEFEKQLPAYYEAALKTAGRILQQPVDKIRVLIEALDPHEADGTLEQMGMNVGDYLALASFISGYGITMLVLKDFHNVEILSQMNT